MLCLVGHSVSIVVERPDVTLAEVNEMHFFNLEIDENENFSYSISHIETTLEFLALNLRLRDKTKKISFNLRHREKIEI